MVPRSSKSEPLCFSNAGCPSRHRTSSINMTYNSAFYTQRDGKWVRAKVQWHSAAGQQWHREGRGTVYPGPRLIVGIPGQAACFLKEVNATKIQSSDYLSVIMRSWFSISNETSQLCACLCPAVRGGHDSRCPRAHFSFWHHSRGIK